MMRSLQLSNVNVFAAFNLPVPSRILAASHMSLAYNNLSRDYIKRLSTRVAVAVAKLMENDDFADGIAHAARTHLSRRQLLKVD